MSSESVNKLLQEYSNIESVLFMTDYSNFENFTQMQNFLQCADEAFTNKIDILQQKMNILHEEYVRASTVYEINNKKRQKEEQLLHIEREKLRNQLQAQKKRLQIAVDPITLVLKQKQQQMGKLIQTKQIMQDFSKLTHGDQSDIKKLMPLDDNNFKSSALKIHIFKQLLQSMQHPDYDLAKNQIRKKYAQLKNKIFINFKQAYYKTDVLLIKVLIIVKLIQGIHILVIRVQETLPYCEEYQLIDQISEFYNQQVFKQSHHITKLNDQNHGQAEIKNFFFLLERGFTNAFGSNKNQQVEKINHHHLIYEALGQQSDTMMRKLVSYAFDKLIKQSLDNVLTSTYHSGLYLSYLQTFYTECKSILKTTQTNEKIYHLMITYFQSLFDTYLEKYILKEQNFLQNIIEEQMSQIIDQIKHSKVMFRDHMETENKKKFSLKKIMDFKIQEKTFNPEAAKLQIRTLISVFTESSNIDQIFMTVRNSLNRNMKISKVNQIDKNRTKILSILIKNLSELMDVLISAIAQIIPGFTDKSPALQPEFFQIVPNINLILQRMEYLYIENKKQTKYQFAETIKLEQKKEALISQCEKKINKIIGDALANILTIENAILKSNQYQYFVLNERQKVRQPSESVCNKVINFLQRYLKEINRITLPSYRTSMLKSIGIQFLTLLIEHYSLIRYNKQGLGMIFIDIANYKKVIMQMEFPEIDQKYKVLRCLIDIYVIKNDEKSINGYVKAEKEEVLKNEKDQTIRNYIENKIKNQIV